MFPRGAKLGLLSNTHDSKKKYQFAVYYYCFSHQSETLVFLLFEETTNQSQISMSRNKTKQEDATLIVLSDINLKK